MYEALRRGSADATELQHAQIYSAQITEAQPKKASIIASSDVIRLLGMGALAVLVGVICTAGFIYFKQLPTDRESTQQSGKSLPDGSEGALTHASVNRSVMLATAANSKPQPPVDSIATKQPEQTKVIEIDRGNQSVVSEQNRPSRQVITNAPKPAALSASLITKAAKDTPATPVQAIEVTKTPVPVASNTQGIQSISAVESVNLADLFDVMNKEIARGNLAEAAKHLQSIQAILPAASISRIRAEGWYDFHQGNLEGARAAYRKILAKIPSDEHALSVMQSIDRRVAASNHQGK